MAIIDETYNTGAQFRVTAVGEWDNNADILNVYEFIKTDLSTQTGANVLSDLEALVRALYTLVSKICNVLTLFKGLRIEELDGTNATGLIPFVGGDIPGLLTTDGAPSGVAALINFPTGIKGVQLRKFYGVLDESILTVRGNISLAGQSDMADIAAFLVSTWSGVGNWHYSHKNLDTGVIVQPTTARVQGIPAYQRRRKINVGS